MLDPKNYIGGIPVIVHLCEQDILSLARRPPPLAFVLPRTTLLIAILRDVLDFFSPYAAALNQYTTQVWFSYESMVVPWGYPAGAVRDFAQELQDIRRRDERLNQRQGIDLISLYSYTRRERDGDRGADAVGASSHRPLTFSFSSEPLELDFRIYQPSGFKTIERCAPFLVNFDRLDEYIRNEIKQLHKMAYCAIYGSYKSYLNSPESVLQAAIAMALYRPFESSLSSDFPDSSLPGSRGFPAFTSPYVLTEYYHMLKSVSRSRRLTYIVQLSFPWEHRGGKCEPVLRFHYHPVDALSSVERCVERQRTIPPSSEGSAVNQESLEIRKQHLAVHAKPASQPCNDADFLLDSDEDGITLGLLLWRLFCAPCLRRQRIFPLSSPSLVCSATASLSAEAAVPTNGVGVSQNVLLRSMAAFYTDPPVSATINLEAHQLPCESELKSEPWSLWEVAMLQKFIETYEMECEDDAEKSLGAWSIFGIPVVDEKGVEGNHKDEPRRLFFKIQGITPSLRTPAKFLETYMTSSDRSLYVTVGVQ